MQCENALHLLFAEGKMSGLSENYTTVSREAHVEFEEKRSLFIGHVIHVDSEEEAQAFIKKMKTINKFPSFSSLL